MVYRKFSRSGRQAALGDLSSLSSCRSLGVAQRTSSNSHCAADPLVQRRGDPSEHRWRRLPVDPAHRTAAGAAAAPSAGVAHELIDDPRGDAGVLQPGREGVAPRPRVWASSGHSAANRRVCRVRSRRAACSGWRRAWRARSLGPRRQPARVAVPPTRASSSESPTRVASISPSLLSGSTGVGGGGP
jgi:hypothetical protein